MPSAPALPAFPDPSPFAASPRPPVAASVTLSAPAASLLTGLLASFLIFFTPRTAARKTLRLSLPKAIFIAAFHLIAGLGWLLLLSTFVAAWQNVRPSNEPGWAMQPVIHFHSFTEAFSFFSKIASNLLDTVIDALHTLAFFDRLGTFGGALLCTTMALAVLFFLLLPFAARPGSNKPCARHVARTVLLATSAIHLWGFLLSAAFLAFFLCHLGNEFGDILCPLFALLSTLILCNFAALVRAARTDYRLPADLPQPRDPLCDNCGYNLTMASPDGRCPECGRPIAESLGPQTRLGTPWELPLARPTAIFRQLQSLIRAPRTLFFQSPTLTGQPAAQRWLLGSLAAVAFAGAWIVPGFYLIDYLTHVSTTLEISWNTFWAAAMMGLTWALLGLMMVGIETAGVAAFSRMKGHPVPFAAAAKVTAFASPLLLAWVLLGGVQVLIAYRYNPLLMAHLSLRAFQVYLAGSLALAHIGGLLWFELTVYRGVRSIQYANK